MRSRRIALATLLLNCLLLGVGLSMPARADMAIIVHPDNPLTRLTEEEVRQIFLGRMRLFPGTQRNIDPVDQDTSLPGFNRFYQIVGNLTPTALQRLRAMYLFSGKGLLPKMLPSEAAVVDFVARHPDAIGYVHKDRTTSSVKTVKIISE